MQSRIKKSTFVNLSEMRRTLQNDTGLERIRKFQLKVCPLSGFRRKGLIVSGYLGSTQKSIVPVCKKIAMCMKMLLIQRSLYSSNMVYEFVFVTYLRDSLHSTVGHTFQIVVRHERWNVGNVDEIQLFILCRHDIVSGCRLRVIYCQRVKASFQI